MDTTLTRCYRDVIFESETRPESEQMRQVYKDARVGDVHAERY